MTTSSFDSMAAGRAFQAEQAQKLAEDNTEEGALARGLPVVNAIRDWEAAEIGRIGPQRAILASAMMMGHRVAEAVVQMERNAGFPREEALEMLLEAIAGAAMEHLQNAAIYAGPTIKIPGAKDA